MEYLFVLPFKDYRGVMTPQWNTKLQIVDLIKAIPEYLFSEKRPVGETPYCQREYFDGERIFNLKNVETYMVKLIR